MVEGGEEEDGGCIGAYGFGLVCGLLVVGGGGSGERLDLLAGR